MQILFRADLDVAVECFEDDTTHATCQNVDEGEKLQENLALRKQVGEVACDPLDYVNEDIIAVLGLVLQEQGQGLANQGRLLE